MTPKLLCVAFHPPPSGHKRAGECPRPVGPGLVMSQNCLCETAGISFPPAPVANRDIPLGEWYRINLLSVPVVAWSGL